ncbi:MAG: hypothetical protein WCF18_14740 [Chthoniobacteraceae bacterium]
MPARFVSKLRVAVLFLCQMAAGEESVPLAQLPPLVLKRLQNDYSAAKLISAAREERNDYVHYFVKMIVGGMERKVEVLENGTVVSDAVNR